MTSRDLPVPESEVRLNRARRVADLMDEAFRIPLTDRRVGMDGLLGLVPVVGDWSTALASGYVVYQGYRTGVPRSTLARMVANVGIDAALGSVPVVGDLFDIGWKANSRNVSLIERHLDLPAADDVDADIDGSFDPDAAVDIEVEADADSSET